MRSRGTVLHERVFKIMRKVHLKKQNTQESIRAFPKYWDNGGKGT